MARMDDKNPNPLDLARVDVGFDVETKEGSQRIGFGIPIKTFYHIYKAIHENGITLETALHIALFGAAIANGQQDLLNEAPVNAVANGQQGHPNKPPVNAVAYQHNVDLIRFYLAQFQNKNFFLDEHWETDEDMLLSFSYKLLRDRDATPKDVAEGVSDILGRTISTDTWLQRVRRWAERNDKGPIGLRKREKTSKRRRE